METRNSSKRKDSDGKQAEDTEPPAKRTRSHSRQNQTPAPPPRSARQRTPKTRTGRNKSSPEAGASSQGAVSGHRAEDTSKPAPAPEEPAAAPNPNDRAEAGSMDASGRRGSRGEAPSGGADEERVREVHSNHYPVQLLTDPCASSLDVYQTYDLLLFAGRR